MLFLPFHTCWHEFHCVWLLKLTIIFVVQLPSRCLNLWTPWAAACQASLSLTISQSLPKFMSIKLVMPSNHLIFCCPLLLPLTFPSIRVFSSESTVCFRCQCFGASTSASVLPKSIQGWFPFKINWFDLLPFQETLKRLIQDHMFLVSTWL